MFLLKPISRLHSHIGKNDVCPEPAASKDIQVRNSRRHQPADSGKKRADLPGHHQVPDAKTQMKQPAAIYIREEYGSVGTGVKPGCGWSQQDNGKIAGHVCMLFAHKGIKH